MKKSIRRNYVYSLFYMIVNTVFPLITAPYISRILGATLLGEVNFATSTATWFASIASFGITNYGVRAVAEVRDDKEKTAMVFTELILINALMVAVTAVVYFGAVMIVPQFRQSFGFMLIASVTLLLNVFMIDWFFQGIEEFKFITVRNTIVKLVSVICIFLLINGQEDAMLYAGISVLGVCINNVVNFLYVRKRTCFSYANCRPFRHMKHLLVYGSANLAGTLYSTFNRVQLGLLAPYSYVAFFQRSNMVVTVALSVMYALSKVVTARATYAYAKGEVQVFRGLVQKSYNMVCMLSFPIMLGLAAVSRPVMYVLGGEEFAAVSSILMVLAAVILPSGLANWSYSQIIIPLGKEKVHLVAQCVAAGLSLVLNSLLIPVIPAYACAVSLFVSEMTVVVIEVICAAKAGVKVHLLQQGMVISLFASCIMFVAVCLLQKMLNANNLPILIAIVVCGVGIYGGIMLLFKEPVTISIWNQLLGRLRRRSQ